MRTERKDSSSYLASLILSVVIFSSYFSYPLCGHLSLNSQSISLFFLSLSHCFSQACMNQKHLLRFIKHKLRYVPNEVVTFRDGKHLTLGEVFESLKLTGNHSSLFFCFTLFQVPQILFHLDNTVLELF